MDSPISPEQHVCLIPGVTSAEITDGRMLVSVEPGLDATTVALRAALVLNALGAGLTVEVAGGQRTAPPPVARPIARWGALTMTNAARVACAAILAGSTGLAAYTDISSSSTPTPALLAGPLHRRPTTPSPHEPSPSAPSTEPPAGPGPAASTPAPAAPPAPGVATLVAQPQPQPAAPHPVELLVAVRRPMAPTPTTPPPTTPPTTTPPTGHVPAPIIYVPPVTHLAPPVVHVTPPTTAPQVVVAAAKPPAVAKTGPSPSPPVTSSGGAGSSTGHDDDHGQGDHHDADPHPTVHHDGGSDQNHGSAHGRSCGASGGHHS